jgi:hypothetical protein
MPIWGWTLQEATEAFRQHINSVLARTVTQTQLILLRTTTTERFQLTFRQAGAVHQARLNTKYGAIYLYLGQTCESDIDPDRRHRLRTVSYRYTLRPEHATDPIFRWEYVKTLGSNELFCRHHVQGPIPISLNRAQLELDDVHLPTGFVTIEEILRFCIVDLGVTPLSDDWHNILSDSYERFKGDFAPRGLP